MWPATNQPGSTYFRGTPQTRKRHTWSCLDATCSQCDTCGAPRIYRAARVFRARRQSSKFVWVWQHAHLITLATNVARHKSTGKHVFFVARLKHASVTHGLAWMQPVHSATLLVCHEFTGHHVFFVATTKRSQTCLVWPSLVWSSLVESSPVWSVQSSPVYSSPVQSSLVWQVQSSLVESSPVLSSPV